MWTTMIVAQVAVVLAILPAAVFLTWYGLRLEFAGRSPVLDQSSSPTWSSSPRLPIAPRCDLVRLDNSFEADPDTGSTPRPTLVLHLAKAKIVEIIDLGATPQWAKALVAAAIKIVKGVSVARRS